MNKLAEIKVETDNPHCQCCGTEGLKEVIRFSGGIFYEDADICSQCLNKAVEMLKGEVTRISAPS